ncbi:unnamed protein product, partial [Rhizoctonia solani]
PRVHRAVAVDPKNVTIDKAPATNGVAQVVSYSSRLVSKLSEVTRTMNITSGASIKAGAVTVSGNQTTIDETKFSAADINAVISVKVINRTELWTLDSVFRAASAFPNRVALNPQRCWAILTRYTQNLSFHSSALKSIPIRNYANVNPYAADLLDDYMEYKANLLSIKKVLDEPIGYALGPGSQPVDVRTEALLAARRKMKEQMGKIVDEIELLNDNPASLAAVMKNSTIESPEVWATRLPKRRTNQPATLASPTPVQNSENVSNLLKMFNFANEAARKAVEDLIANPNPVTPAQDSTTPSSSGSLPILATESAQSTMSTAEKTFVNSSENRRVYGALFRFDQPGGTPDRALNFNDAETIQDAVRAGWPTEITFQMVIWGTSTLLGLCRVGYTQLNLSHGGSENAQGQAALVLRLGSDERVVRLKIGFGPEVNRVKGVRFIEVWVTPQGHRALGDEAGCEKVLDCAAPDGFVGLKGFYGYEQSGKVVERIGVIWGSE